MIGLKERDGRERWIENLTHSRRKKQFWSECECNKINHFRAGWKGRWNVTISSRGRRRKKRRRRERLGIEEVNVLNN